MSGRISTVGPNASLVQNDIEAAVRGLKALSKLGRLMLQDQTWQEA
jgi:hypothetical protein